MRKWGWRQALAAVEVDSEAMVADLRGQLGLPLTLSGGPPLELPAAAPFSRSVPHILHALRRFTPAFLSPCCPTLAVYASFHLWRPYLHYFVMRIE